MDEPPRASWQRTRAWRDACICVREPLATWLRHALFFCAALVLGCGGDDRPLDTNPSPQSCRTFARSGLSVAVWNDALLTRLCDAIVLASSDTHFEQLEERNDGSCGV